MRLMETIRRKGGVWLVGFLAFFLISVFAGLGVGAFQFNRAAQQASQNTAPVVPLLTEQGNLDDVALRINGQPVSSLDFNNYLAQVVENARSSFDDPALMLDAYAYVATRLIWEQVVRQRGEELGVTVTSQDIEDAKDEAIQQYLPETSGSSGNVLGDLARNLGSTRQRKAAFNEFLLRANLTESTWRDRVRDELFVANTTEHIRDTANDKKRLEAEETKLKVDEELAAGELFQEVVRKYSDDDLAEAGGDIGTWVRRGLLDESIEDELYALPEGTTSSWHEVGVGFQKFHVYAVRMPEGEELEEARTAAVERLKEENGEEYEPSDEEITAEVEQAEKNIKYYLLQLNTSIPNVAYDELQEHLLSAKVEINEPFVLAHQALMGEKLQPPAGVGFEELKKLAQNSAAGEGYDFELINKKLKAGKPEAADEATDPAAMENESGATAGEGLDEATESDETGAVAEAESGAAAAEDAADSADMADAGAAGTEDAPAPAGDAETEPEAAVPIYALGIGLLKDAMEKRGEEGSTVANYLIAKTYMDWLADDAQAASQPLDRQAAREEAEEHFARAVERFNYSPQVYAWRGLNLAWLDNKQLAVEQLELAQKYAPKETGGVWTTIKEAYEVIGDEKKIAMIDELISKIRQEQLEQAIRSKTGQPGTTPDNPITINLDDMAPAGDTGSAEDEGGGEDGDEGGDGSASGEAGQE